MQAKVRDFLTRHDMHYSNVDLEKGHREFAEEMERGLRGEQSSLLMIPTYLQVKRQIPLNEEIIVMDAGGTNFRVATVTFDSNGAPIVDNFEKSPMPGTQGRLDREAFFDAIADKLMPVIHISQTVGFCFSYPCDIYPNRDGKPVFFTKEVRVDGVVGEFVGEGINEALAKRGIGPKNFVLLNDTVATMLGGVAASGDFVYESYIGYILGTGTNTCYLEDSANITKSPEAVAMGGKMIINMESGGYNRVIQGKIDRELDEASKNPGSQVMEKMISGAYQGNVIYRTVKQAADEGLFSGQFGQRAESLEDISMYDVDQFCFYPYGDNTLARIARGSDEDVLTLYEIIDASFERAARLTAINFGAILTQTGSGKNPTKPVCIAAEGTTFYKSKLFKGKLDYYVRSFLGDRLGVYCEFVKTDNATLLGTAVAGLLNKNC